MLSGILVLYWSCSVVNTGNELPPEFILFTLEGTMSFGWYGGGGGGISLQGLRSGRYQFYLGLVCVDRVAIMLLVYGRGGCVRVSPGAIITCVNIKFKMKSHNPSTSRIPP